MILQFNREDSNVEAASDNPVSFQAVLQDLIARFGTPSGPEVFVTGMGPPPGDLPNEFAEWNLPDVYVLLKQFKLGNRSEGHIISLSITTSEEYDRATGHSVRHRDLLQ